MSSSDSRIPAPLLMAGALLSFVCLHLFFYKLDAEGIASEAEARPLLGAIEMDREGQWIAGTVAGEPRWDKPPLHLWAVQLSADLQGDYTPEAARTPGALAATLLVLLGAWWMHRHLARSPREDDPDMGLEAPTLMAGLLLATNPLVFHYARSGVADPVFALFCFAAAYCFSESVEMRRGFFAEDSWRRPILIGYLFLGLATLAKGPTAFLFVIPPYVATCLHYRMNRPDRIHLWGLLVSCVVGGWWYLLALVRSPDAAGVFWQELVLKRFGGGAYAAGPIWFYLVGLLVVFFPWAGPAAGMIHRTLVRHDRTPTRLMWTWSVVLGVAWLSLVGSKRPAYFLPVAPFVPLLAMDGLTHWAFDTRIGRAFRVMNRIVRWIAVLAGFAISLLIGSDIGVALSVALALGSFWLLFHRRRRGIVFAMWERTMQGAWFLVAIFLAAETVYIREYVARKDLLDPVAGFVERVRASLPARSDLHLAERDRIAMYSLLLDEALPVASDVEGLLGAANPETFLLSDNPTRVGRLAARPDLAIVAERLDPRRMRIDAALFKVRPGLRAEGASDGATTATFAAASLSPADLALWEDRYTSVAPLRVAVLGDAGRRRGGEKDTVKAAESRDALEPLSHAIMLGESLAPESALDRIDFIKSFERPYRRLLARGVPTHGVIGPRDADILPVLERYPLLRMGGRRHYAFDMRAGLARFVALDANELAAGGGEAAAQIDWLREDLRSSRAIWKIVALDAPLFAGELAGAATPPPSEGEDARPPAAVLPKAVLESLLETLRAGGTDVVLTAGRACYERRELDGLLLLEAGFSSMAAREEADPGIESANGSAFGWSATPGFVLLEIRPGRLDYEAVADDGSTIDRGSRPRVRSGSN